MTLMVLLIPSTMLVFRGAAASQDVVPLALQTLRKQFERDDTTVVA